jgi:hypothetical protein
MKSIANVKSFIVLSLLLVLFNVAPFFTRPVLGFTSVSVTRVTTTPSLKAGVKVRKVVALLPLPQSPSLGGQGKMRSGSTFTYYNNLLFSSPNNDNDKDRLERLRNLGYSAKEISQMSNNNNNNEDKETPNVRVDLVEDVDPLTLTAIGFTLIAFNFLVLGNLGDGGIGGLVATAINLLNQ